MEPKVTSKYPNWTRGHVEALLNIIGEKNARRLLSGDLLVRFEEAVQKLFDKNGQRVRGTLKSNVCDPDKKYKIEQPSVKFLGDYDYRLTSLQQNIKGDIGITAEDFEKETKRLLEIIKKNPQISNITKGPFFPIVVWPGLFEEDIDTKMKWLSSSYKEIFSDKNFKEFKPINDSISHVKEGRYETLIGAVKNEPIVVLFFPTALQGYSVRAAWEQMATLPEGFFLSGIDTTIIAITMYADSLAKDWHTTGLNLAGSHSYHYFVFEFKSLNDGMAFGTTSFINESADHYSSGLLFFK